MSSDKNKSAIDLQTVRHIALLAQLELQPDEESLLLEQMNKILSYFHVLDQLDTKDVLPMSHSLTLETPFGADQPQPSLPVEKALANAPDQAEEQIRVPAVIE